MWMRATRWTVAALIGSAMTTIGCGRPAADEPRRASDPTIADDNLTHAFDTRLEVRLLDHLEPDHLLRNREIRIKVADGLVSITGEVWTPLGKRRGSALRNGAGVVDVASQLEVRPPR